MAGTAVSSVSLIKVYLAVLFVTSRTCLCMLGRCPFLLHERHLSKIFHVATHILLTMYCLHLVAQCTYFDPPYWSPYPLMDPVPPPPSIFASCRDSHAALLSTPLSSCCAIAAMSAPSWRRRPPLLQPLLRSSLCPACAEFRNRGVDFTFKAFDFERLARGQDWEGWGGLTWSEAPWGTEGATKQVLVKNMEAKADFTRAATTLPYVFFISW